MPRLAIVGGHSLLGADWPALATRRTVAGPGGDTIVVDAGDYLVLQRHGLDDYTAAHRIEHARNLGALHAMGCERVLAISSVGSLRAELAVGTFVVPHDFIALDQPPMSVFDDQRAHVVPAFDAAWRDEIVRTWGRRAGVPLMVGGVYWQSNGPRFETPAEVRMQAQFADLVGMTVGSECVVACELGLEYAAVCVVDNLANGIGGRPLTRVDFEAGKSANQARLLAALAAVVPELAQ